MIKTAVIGAGAMGLRHVKAINLSPDFKFCGISDLRSPALQKCVQEGIGAESCFYDTDKMLAQTKPDCVVIATTASSHAALADMVMERGIPLLLVEKPLCISLEQLEKLREKEVKHGARVAVNHSVRFCGNYIKLKELCNTDGLGDMGAMTLTAGAMGLAMGGSHQLELFHFITGQEHEEIWAWLEPDLYQNPRGAEFQDAAGQVYLKTKSGLRHYMEIGAKLGHGMRITVSFEHGQVHADIFGREAIVSMRRPEDRHFPPTRYGLPAIVSRHVLPAFDVVEASSLMLEALAKGKNYPDLERSGQIIRTLAAAYVSSEMGHQGISIRGDLPMYRKFAWA